MVPLLKAWMGHDVHLPLFLTQATDEGPVVERPYSARGGRLELVVASCPVPPPLQWLMDSLIACEELAAAAILSRFETDLETALKAHPWVTQRGSARRMARQIVAQSLEVDSEEGSVLSA